MSIKVRLLNDAILEKLMLHIEDFEIDADEIADSVATYLLDEIQKIIKDDNNNDFDIVEKIVCLFESYHIDCGGCHDFG